MLSAGLNFDFPKGYDGGILLGTKAVQTVTTQVTPHGSINVTLDVPSSSNAFQVRVLVTDPTSGVVHTATRVGTPL